MRNLKTVLKSALDRLIEARQQQANRELARYRERFEIDPKK